MKQLLTLTAVVCLILSCSETTEQPQSNKDFVHEHSDKSDHLSEELRTYHSKIVEIHDSIMPEINKINRYKIEIKHILEDSVSEELSVLYNRLDEADTLMMGWMREHAKTHFNYDEVKNEEILNDLMDKIVIVRDKMKSSIEDAKIILRVE